MVKKETSLSAKLNTVTKENAKLKKELAQLKNDYKDTIPTEMAREFNRLSLHNAYLIFTNPKAMELVEIFVTGWKNVCDMDNLIHDIVAGYTRYDTKIKEGKQPGGITILDSLIRDLYNIINPKKRKEVTKGYKWEKTCSNK